ncbi:hypothetical protein F0562_029372 [Nyssa sinensis]|uniref:BED-type domain-containing protein n=1 Tax=Nyssa sinensis TaxID=561372 RepID=A0A5J5B2T4_9ASTE|nr:hypothetical protein F0562_029372 [Nyssa sinensis]
MIICDMSIGQPGFTSQEHDSCNPFSFEESSTSPLMEDIDQDGIDMGGISNDERNNGNDEGNNESRGNETNDTQNEDADPHKHAFQRKPRKRTSTIWNDFEEVVDTDRSKKVKCNYCLAKFNMPSTGATTQFHRHLKRCTQHQLASKKQTVLSVETVASECAGSIANFKYDRAKKCFIEWGIEDKVSTITVDNARYNDVALRILKDNFTLKKKLSFGGRIFHVRCCAHIINLLVQDGIKEVKGIVDIVREGVKYLIASDARMIQFSDIAKQLQLSSKKLILDCPTRWNSTYMMLATALKFREVFPRYQDRDSSFIYVPSVEDWVKVEHVCHFLGTFNVVTNIISGTEYPTANLFLSELWRIKVLLNEKSVDDNEFIRAMASMMKAKFDKYWSECNLLMAIAAILDPRYKMIIVNYCFPDIYPEAEANRNIVTVKQALYEIYNEYVVTHAATHTVQGEGGQGTTREIGSSSASGGDHDIGQTIVTGSSLILGHVSRTVDTIQPSKSDLDVYLDESAFICAEGSANKFNIMEWWKANTLKFRILSKMARDILSIPITSVASESTFSAGGRVIDPYRASLLPETVQVLLCGADWVRALHGLKKGSEASHHFWPTTGKCHNNCIRAAFGKFNAVEDKSAQMNQHGLLWFSLVTFLLASQLGRENSTLNRSRDNIKPVITSEARANGKSVKPARTGIPFILKEASFSSQFFARFSPIVAIANDMDFNPSLDLQIE